MAPKSKKSPPICSVEEFTVVLDEIAKASLEKDEIKALLTDDERAQIGTEIEKKETFWVEPKQEAQEPITAALENGKAVAA